MTTANDNKWCEIFRAGKYKGRDGEDLTYTEADLDLIVKNFNEAENPMVPNVVGHPEDNSPAYGWVESLKREGKKLFATFKDVPAEFMEAVNKGLFKNRSISLYPNLMLRHVGWLGAMPPKVKGMEPFCFKDDVQLVTTIEFSEFEDYKFETISRFFQNMRDFFIEKFGLDKTNELITPYGIDLIKKIEDNPPKTVPISAFSEGGKEQELTNVTPPAPSDIPAQNTSEFVSAAEFAEMKKANNEKDTKIQELEGQIDKINSDNRKKEFTQFADELIAKGNITPALKSFVVDFQEICHNQNTFDFAEGEEKSALKRFQDFCKTLKKVNFAEITKKGNVDTAPAVDFSDANSVKTAIDNLVNEAAKNGETLTREAALTMLEGGSNV